MKMPRRSCLLCALALACVCSAAADPASPETVEHLRAEVLASHPHDPTAFTQGLVFAGGGRLFESTGLYGQSTLREVDIATGNVLRSTPLQPTVFGEGLALANGRLVLLTWRERTAFLFDPTTFGLLGFFPFTGEGWGLCFDGSRFIMSNGSSQLIFRDAQTFDPVASVTVTLGGTPQDRINELEWAEGAVYANVLQEDHILRIDPATGAVTAVIDASGLLTPAQAAGADVLNGIAFDPETDVYFLTGKLWPLLFETRFVAQPASWEIPVSTVLN